ncbi:MAG: 50S ribosomal protein L11 methyltransferase [Halofilum sp. (in: g-proteobacteria)]
MPWLQVKVATNPEYTQAVEDALTAAGAASVTLEGADESLVLEPAPGETPLWGTTRVIGLFDDSIGRGAVLDALAGLGEEAAAEPVFEQLPDREWSRVWLEDWAPLRFGRHLWVAPHEATVDDPAATVIRLDPGVAFGTGTHATTALCLEWLTERELGGARVLDFGCGSGVLAIAALRLGAARAHGIDIDPQAVEASATNADDNGVGERLTSAVGDAPEGGPYDVILANVLAGPLIEVAPALAACHNPGGHIALAGILSDQTQSVIEAYQQAGYEVTVSAEREGWSLVTGYRRTHATA